MDADYQQVEKRLRVGPTSSSQAASGTGVWGLRDRLDLTQAASASLTAAHHNSDGIIYEEVGDARVILGLMTMEQVREERRAAAKTKLPVGSLSGAS